MYTYSARGMFKLKHFFSKVGIFGRQRGMNETPVLRRADYVVTKHPKKLGWMTF